MPVGFVAPSQTAVVVNQHLVVLSEFRHLEDPPGGETDAGTGYKDGRTAFVSRHPIHIINSLPLLTALGKISLHARVRA